MESVNNDHDNCDHKHGKSIVKDHEVYFGEGKNDILNQLNAVMMTLVVLHFLEPMPVLIPVERKKATKN
jgi:hypothetical protein